jgi:ABC-type transport system involved in multi-copper enzyme maturation permease subunit
MMAELKSEFRKLLTIRSTYYLLGLTLFLVLLVGFYIEGYRLDAKQLSDPMLLNNSVTDAISSLILFAGIVGLLLMTHEYRYNTIIYTLTASRSRSKVLAAKIIALSVFALIFVALVGILSPLMTDLGVHVARHTDLMAPQTINYGDVAWRLLYYSWAYVIAALMLAVIIRNQVAAIVSLFLIPTVEALLTLLLKNNGVYLPFTALGAVVTHPSQGSITPARAALVFAAYLIVGWAVAWILFSRRDAN